MFRKTVKDLLKGTPWYSDFQNKKGVRYLLKQCGNLKVSFPAHIKSISYYGLHKMAKKKEQIHIYQDDKYYCHLPEMDPFKDALCIMTHLSLSGIPIAEVFEYRQAPFKEVISLTSTTVLRLHFDKFNIFCSDGTVVKDISKIYLDNEYIAISKQTLASAGNFHIVMRYIPASKISDLDNYNYRNRFF